MTPKLKKIIVAVLVLGVCFLAYVLFLKPDPTAEVLVSGGSFDLQSGEPSTEARLLASQITQALLRVQQISLDKTLFSDPLFVSLEDRSTPIIEEPLGRSNPFAPLGDTSVRTSSRTDETATTTATSTPASFTATSTATTTTSSTTRTATSTSVQ